MNKSIIFNNFTITLFQSTQILQKEKIIIKRMVVLVLWSTHSFRGCRSVPLPIELLPVFHTSVRDCSQNSQLLCYRIDWLMMCLSLTFSPFWCVDYSRFFFLHNCAVRRKGESAWCYFFHVELIRSLHIQLSCPDYRLWRWRQCLNPLFLKCRNGLSGPF